MRNHIPKSRESLKKKTKPNQNPDLSMKMLKTTPKGSMYSRRLPVAVLDPTPPWAGRDTARPWLLVRVGSTCPACPPPG